MQYYKNFNPILLENSNWRHFRFRLQNGKFVSIRSRINSPEKLKFLLMKLNPKDAYQTISCFLNPERLSSKNFRKHKKAGFQITYNNFLWSDMLIDIDALSGDEKRANPEKCKDRFESFQNCEKIYDILRENYSKIKSVETFRGYQLLCFDWKDEIRERIEKLGIFHTKKREEIFSQEKKKFCDMLRKKKIKFDYDTSIDTRRICRIPNTLHNKGVICRISDNPIFRPYAYPIAQSNSEDRLDLVSNETIVLSQRGRKAGGNCSIGQGGSSPLFFSRFIQSDKEKSLNEKPHRIKAVGEMLC